MSDISINIRGNNGGGGSNPSPNDSRQGQSLPPNERLIDEVRQMIIDQRNANPRQNIGKAVNAVQESELQDKYKEISQRYEERRADLSKRAAEEEYRRVDEDITARRSSALRGVNSKEAIEWTNSYYDQQLETEYRRIGRMVDTGNILGSDERNQLQQDEADERNQAERNLTSVIEILTDEIKRNGGSLNPNSFLAKLRAQRQEAITEREEANDEESSKNAAEKVRNINAQIDEIVRGKPVKEVDFGSRALGTMLSFDEIVRGLTGRDIGSVIMGGAQSVTSMLGLSDKAASRSLAWVKPIATIGTLLTQEAEKSDQMAGLSALIRGNKSIQDVRSSLYQNMWNFSPFGGGVASIWDMGMSVPEFAQSAERRIKQRGSSRGGVIEAYLQEALERVYSLDAGALGEAGKYDRYGINATDAITNLMTNLEGIRNSGVSQGNYARAQEYLGMQQDLMANYMRFSNRPSYALANRDIEAFSSLKGYQVDSRMPQDIKAVQNMIVSPQNDRQKAILYSTVEQMFPETRGRTDLIDRYINDPRRQGMIERGYMRQIQTMYGGVNTPIGYWGFKSLLQGIESPERRDAIVNGLISGEAGNRMATSPTFTGSNKVGMAGQVQGYSSDITKGMIQLSDGIYAGVSILEKLSENVGKLVSGKEGFFEFLKSTFK